MYDLFHKSPVATTDRRRYARVPFLKPVMVTTPGGKALSTQTTDISDGGVGFTCRVSFRVGEPVVVTFRLNDSNHRVCEERIPGKVVNFQADFEANRVGVEFNEPLHPSKFPLLSQAVNRL